MLGLRRRFRSHHMDDDVFDSPSPPDINQLKKEAAEIIQSRVRRRRRRRKLTKKSPRHGKRVTPTTERERWRQISELNEYLRDKDIDDPAIGYTQSLIPERLLPGQEEKRDHDHLDWLQSFSQYDGGRRRRRNRTRKRRYKFY